MSLRTSLILGTSLFALLVAVACDPNTRELDEGTEVTVPELSADQEAAQIEEVRKREQQEEELISRVTPLTEEEELSLMEKSREQQKIQRFDQIASGGNSCKYLSTLSSTPPAKTVVLTFDDGPDPLYTPEILATLSRHNVKATFFMLGEQAKKNPALVRQVKNEGHIIASHSYNHANFHTIPGDSRKAQRAQITSTETQLSTLMGQQKFFRYPFGNSTCETNEFLRRKSYKLVGWHGDSCDWAYQATGKITERQAKICEVQPENRDNFVGNLVQQVDRYNGGIVLMHDRRQITATSLNEIIVNLLSKGYRFTNLNDPSYAGSLR